jgi:acyl-CoA hydrolase
VDYVVTEYGVAYLFGKNLWQRENEIVLGTHGRSINIAKLEEVQKKAEQQ